MKKIWCALLCLLGLTISGLLGFYLGRSDHAHAVAFEEDKATGSVVIYSYYVRPDGERVIDGKHYTISPTTRIIKTYRDGALQGVSSTSIHF